jgi:sensor histidine kinase YesM
MNDPRQNMAMNQESARERVKRLWRWRSSRGLLIGASAVTVVISLFEIKLDAVAMLREIASNFITCVSITFITATILAAFDIKGASRSWKRAPLLLLLLALGGILGGLISWGVNDLLFPYRISHPTIYMMVVAILAIIFGLAALAYENISMRLDETASKLAEKEIQEQRLSRLKTEAELDALRAKVNPHFLFNTLNSIASLIPEDPHKAEDMVQKLSNLLHHVLTESGTGMVPLERELNFVTEYLAVEKVRFADRLQYAVDRNPGLDGTCIPSMLLQPLVENSVKHGIAPKKNGGKIDLECKRTGNRCLITIVDTGSGFDTELTEEGFGIGGVRQRLDLIYPGTHRFDVTSERGHGAKVEIEIPITNGLQNSSH